MLSLHFHTEAPFNHWIMRSKTKALEIADWMAYYFAQAQGVGITLIT
jgi:hypothetical protein